MKKVFFQGTFDILNWGHIMAFRDAKNQGDYLIVGLNSDKLVKSYKKREPILPFWQRKAILESIRWVDEVVQIDKFSPLQTLKDLNIDVYVIALEWKESKKKEMVYMRSKGGAVFFTPEYEGVIHSSEIRKRCVQEFLKKKGAGK
jgi:glycerol-3-phosphate cytidylyltransferase